MVFSDLRKLLEEREVARYYLVLEKVVVMTLLLMTPTREQKMMTKKPAVEDVLKHAALNFNIINTTCREGIILERRVLSTL